MALPEDAHKKSIILLFAEDLDGNSNNLALALDSWAFTGWSSKDMKDAESKIQPYVWVVGHGQVGKAAYLKLDGSTQRTVDWLMNWAISQPTVSHIIDTCCYPGTRRQRAIQWTGYKGEYITRRYDAPQPGFGLNPTLDAMTQLKAWYNLHEYGLW